MRFAYLGLLAATVVLIAALQGAFADESGKYRVGDRLNQVPRASAPKSIYQQIGWEALIPEDWDPVKAFRNLDLGSLDDSDKRAMAALAQLKKAWDTAPIVPRWNGQRVRIPGFVVPLERRGEDITEFLLVPYFGACIHTPPPPANQIIHVYPAKPVKNLRTMDAVWVIGVLDTTRPEAQIDTERGMGMGTAGYRMTADNIAPYKGP